MKREHEIQESITKQEIDKLGSVRIKGQRGKGSRRVHGSQFIVSIGVIKKEIYNVL